MAEPAPTPEPAQEAPPEPHVQAFESEAGHVALYDGDGNLMSVPTENALKAVQEYGYKPAPKADVVASHEGAYGTFKAGLYGAARGASFGTFDPIAVEASRQIYGEQGADLAREELNLMKQGHETASLAGEIGGSLLPLAVGGGGGAAATSESILGRTAQRVVMGAPRAFAEGAAISAGQQLTEDTLGDHELSAAKYATTALEGGLLGAIIGSGLHAGVGLAGDALALRAAAKGEGVAAKGLGTKLSAFAETQAAKGMLPPGSIGANEVQKLGRTVEEQQTKLGQLGRTGLDEGISTAGASKAVQAERAAKRVEEVGAELGSIRKSLEESAVRPSSETILKRVGDEVIKPLMDRPFSWADQSAVKPYVHDIVKGLGGTMTEAGEVALKKPTAESFDQVFQLRSRLGKKLESMRSWEKANLGAEAPGHADLRQIYGIVEDEFEKAADRAAVDLDENIGQKYRVQKALFGDLKTIEKWTSKASAKESQNRAISLTDTIAASSGIGSALAGHPLGLLAPVANKLARTYGNQAAALVADKAAKLAGVQRAAETFDVRVEKAAEGFFKGGKKGRGVPSGANPSVDAETARALRQAVQDPAALTERVSQAVERTGLRTSAPKIAAAMTGLLMRAASYIGANMPPEPQPTSFTFGVPKARAPGPQQQAKVDAVVGALDLDSLLADIERGRADRQKVEALRIISPQAHAALMQALEKKGIEHAAELTHQQEVAMSILTGRPIGAMMQPRTIRGFQQAHTQGTPPDPSEQAGVTRQSFGGGGGGGGGGGTSHNADTFRTGMDRLEAGDG